MKHEDAERRYAQIEGERDYYKKLADSRAIELETYREAEQVQIALRRKADEQRDAALEREHALAALAEEIRNELRDRAVQTWCGCEHPACKRCRDDEDTERVLAIKTESSLARRDLIKQA